jgi:hypothetical protein
MGGCGEVIRAGGAQQPAGERRLLRASRTRSVVPVPRACSRRLSVGLIALPYYRDTYPAIVAESRHVIAEVLADHQRNG